MSRTDVEIRELPARRRIALPDGRRHLVGQTLAELVEILGGFSGHLVHPVSGKQVWVSLAAWEARDPVSTILEVSFLEWSSGAAGTTPLERP